MDNKRIDRDIKRIKKGLKNCGEVERLSKLKKALGEYYKSANFERNYDALASRDVYLMREQNRQISFFPSIIAGLVSGAIASLLVELGRNAVDYPHPYIWIITFVLQSSLFVATILFFSRFIYSTQNVFGKIKSVQKGTKKLAVGQE